MILSSVVVVAVVTTVHDGTVVGWKRGPLPRVWRTRDFTRTDDDSILDTEPGILLSLRSEHDVV